MYYLPLLFKRLRGVAAKRTRFFPHVKLASGSQFIDCRIGDYSDIGYDCKMRNVTMGKYCSVACNVAIGLESHPLDNASISAFLFPKNLHDYDNVAETVIGNDVWIGWGALIKPGVKIGNGAVVGMGSVVTKDVLPYEIVAGNPAKHIRYRFDGKTIERMETSMWWDLPYKDLVLLKTVVGDPNAFLDALEQFRDNQSR